MSYLAELISMQERDEAMREMEAWRAAYLMREVVKPQPDTNEDKNETDGQRR